MNHVTLESFLRQSVTKSVTANANAVVLGKYTRNSEGLKLRSAVPARTGPLQG